MSTIGWIIVAAAIAVVVIVAILVIARISSSRRSSHLQEQFGPEYDRAVDASDSRERPRRTWPNANGEHSKLDLKPLSSGARDAVHGRVVGRPAAVSRRSGGSRLAGRASRPPRHGRARLPAGQRDDDRAAIVSVDHPDVVERYRHGRETLDVRDVAQDERTENLRVAMVDFRAVLESLLETDSELAMTR